MKKKLIITLVVVLVVCGAGGIIAMNSMDKVVASNKDNTATKTSTDVEQNNKKDTNVNEQATVTKSTEASQQNSSTPKNQNGATINQNNKATTNPKNTNQEAPIAVVTNAVKSTSQENTSNATKSSNNNNETTYIDNLINNLYNSSWHQIKAIDSSFDKNGTEGSELYSQIEMAVNRLNFGVSDPEKYKLKAEVIKTENQNSTQTVYINLGSIDSKLKGYYDEIKPI
ncbi:MAG: hypothetical protein ACRDDY_13125 [Clostridium sp.]|uniref:hypothetical protein n=1 Tax=Clostridium sp. TaxID=1506 RepID=UPI003EE7579D